MKINYQRYLMICLFFVSLVYAQQPTPEEVFHTKIKILLKDAETGFQSTIGDYKDTNFMGRSYNCNSAIASFKNCEIFYKPETYYKHAGETEPQMFYFTENFKTNEESGMVVKANVEMIFDELAATMGLYKVVKKFKKKERDQFREIEYLDKKTNLRVLYFKEYIAGNAILLQIHSDLKPADLPKYNGCIVLYNMQSGNVLSALALYVYGEGFESEAKLYSNALSKMKGSSVSNYKQYEYFPSGRVRDVEYKLDGLGITYYSERINPEGYGIP